MWSAITKLLSERRRFAPLVLILGAAVVVLQVSRAAPTETYVRVRLAPVPGLEELSIAYMQGGDEVVTSRHSVGSEGLTYISTHPHLSPGRYDVRIDLHLHDHVDTVWRMLDVPAEGSVTFDLRTRGNE